jgi:hypothetical protein
MNGEVAIIKHLHTGQLQQGEMGGGERGGVTPPAPPPLHLQATAGSSSNNFFMYWSDPLCTLQFPVDF